MTPDGAPPAALELAGVGGGYDRTPVVCDVSASVDAGDVVCLLGPNGSGKTTLLKLISGLIGPADGRIRLGGHDVTDWSTGSRVRGGLTHLLQEVSVFPRMTVRENVMLGGYTSPKGGEADTRAVALRALFPVVDELWDQKAGRLSRGQQRLVEIARMLMTDPRVVLLDEPSIGLDAAHADLVFGEVRRMAHRGIAVVLAEQNRRRGLAVADRVWVMERGRLVENTSGPAAASGARERPVPADRREECRDA